MTAALLLLSLIYGCGQEEMLQQKERTTITLWYYWDVPHNQQELVKLANAFNQTQDAIEVKLQYVPDEDFKKRLALSMAGNTMPDLALVDSADFRFFNNMQPFVDLTDEIIELDQYLPISMEPCTIDGIVRGLPFGMNCLALFYNKDQLDQAGCSVPETWDAFYDTAVKTTKNGRYGFAIPGLRSEESAFGFLPVIWSMGGDAYYLDSKECKRAFRLLAELRETGALSRKCINLTMGDLTSQFVEGNIAMMFNLPMAVTTIREKNPKLNFDVTYLPSDGENISILGGEIFAVTPGENQDAAITFLRYLANKERMAGYIDNFGFLAAREDVMEHQYTADPLRHKFLSIYKTAKPRRFTEHWPEVSIAISDAMGEVILGEKNFDDIIEDANEKIAQIRGNDS